MADMAIEGAGTHTRLTIWTVPGTMLIPSTIRNFMLREYGFGGYRFVVHSIEVTVTACSCTVIED